MSKFWRFQTVTNQIDTETESTENVLFFDGVIAEESWYSDDITPQMFRDELKQHSGDLTVWINSPGCRYDIRQESNGHEHHIGNAEKAETHRKTKG